MSTSTWDMPYVARGTWDALVELKVPCIAAPICLATPSRRVYFTLRMLLANSTPNHRSAGCSVLRRQISRTKAASGLLVRHSWKTPRHTAQDTRCVCANLRVRTLVRTVGLLIQSIPLIPLCVASTEYGSMKDVLCSVLLPLFSRLPCTSTLHGVVY